VGPYFAVVDAARMFSLVVGSLVIFLGILRANYCETVTDATLNLVLDPTWPAVAITAVIIAVRQLIAFSLSLARSG
jgi:hypothetical protein